MQMIFAKDSSRIGRKHSWNRMKRRKQEPGRVQFEEERGQVLQNDIVLL
jgi:hypothetical protein